MDTSSPFTKFVYRADRAGILRLLKSNHDLNEPDGHGRTVLMHAVLDDRASAEFIRWLIELGADVNQADRGRRWRALHFAAVDQKLDIVQVLLANGAEVNAEDVDGNTPLIECIADSHTDPKVVQLLIDSGANPQKTSKKGHSAIGLAIEFELDEVIRILKGAQEGGAEKSD